MTYPKIQKIKTIIFYPFRLVALPCIIMVGFFATDFSDEWEVDYFKDMIKRAIKPL